MTVTADSLKPAIVGALRETIRAHGPIEPDGIESASKRIAGQIAATLTERYRREHGFETAGPDVRRQG